MATVVMDICYTPSRYCFDVETSNQPGTNIEQDNLLIFQGKLGTESLLFLKHVCINFISGTSEGGLFTARNYVLTI